MREVPVDTDPAPVAKPVEFADFVAAENAALLRFAWALTGNWSTAEDLVQTALVAAWPRWSSVRGQDPAPYVRRILVTTCLRWQRRRWRGEISTPDLPRSAAARDDFGSWHNRDAVMGVLLRLPPRQRAVIVVSYFLDLSEKDAAVILGCSTGTIKRQKHAALARLRGEPELAAILRGDSA